MSLLKRFACKKCVIIFICSPPNQIVNRVLPVQVIQDRSSTPCSSNVKNTR